MDYHKRLWIITEEADSGLQEEADSGLQEEAASRLPKDADSGLKTLILRGFVSNLAKDGRIPRPPPPGKPHGHTPHGWFRGHAPENEEVP